MTATTLPTGDVAAPDDGIAGAYTRHWLRAGVQIGYSAGLPIPPTAGFATPVRGPEVENAAFGEQNHASHSDQRVALGSHKPSACGYKPAARRAAMTTGLFGMSAQTISK